MQPLPIISLLDELGDAAPGLGQVSILRSMVEWRGAFQLRALPEPDMSLSTHPAPIIGPLVPGSNERTVLDCDVLPNATSPKSPSRGLETACIYEWPIAQ